MPRRTILWIAFAVAVVAGAGILSVGRTLRQPRAVEVLRDSLQAVRSAADSCRTVLDDGQAGLREHNALLDSMRDRVRELESYDPRGVPVDSYAVYMDVFEAYRDSAAGWDARIEVLQDARERCRLVTERHNLLADSLRRLLIDARR
ncbi:MAG TPA: hypothetical protein VK936_05240 [Longimicrobiales bacterium]|nr:hypothetical protein [Longimicrobiales bacterium]